LVLNFFKINLIKPKETSTILEPNDSTFVGTNLSNLLPWPNGPVPYEMKEILNCEPLPQVYNSPSFIHAECFSPHAIF
jgi:hypothetical protein